MFVIKEGKTFRWPVDVNEPMDGGTFQTHRFEATFKLLDQDSITERLQTSDTDLLSDVVLGWADVRDEEKNDVPFSPENRARLLALPYVRVGLVRAYFEAVNGAKRKN